MKPPAPRDSGLLDKIAKVADVFRDEAAYCDEITKVSPKSEEALRSTGIVKFLHPEDFGGIEGHPAEFVEGAIEIASLNSSAGWISGVVGVHPQEVALADRELQEEIWGSQAPLGAETWIASPYAPGGNLVPQPGGGYKLSGRWPYSSGCELCQWVTIGAFKADADGEVRDRTTVHVAVPIEDLTIDQDSWNVFGLKGTGSKDLVIDGVFVPEHRVIELEGITEGTAAAEAGRADSPVFYMPRNIVFAGAVTAATLGISKGVVTKVLEINKERQARHGKASTDPYQLAALGKAAADIDASIFHVLRDVERAYEIASRGEHIPMSARAEVRRNQVAASLRAAAAADSVFRISGGVGVYEDFDLARRWRDAQAAIHHIHNLGEPVWQSWGLMYFGYDKLPTIKF